MITRRSFLGVIASLPFLNPTYVLAYKTTPNDDFPTITTRKPKAERTASHEGFTWEIIDNFLESYKDSQLGHDLANDELASAIVQGAIDEDRHIAEDGEMFRYQWHFYNPNRADGKRGLQRNFPLNDGSRDALKRALMLEERMKNAFASNDKKSGYHLLGRVLHLIEDMGTPEHVYLVDHGPRLATVACKDNAGLQLYDTNSDIFKKFIAPNLKSEQVDWGRCVVGTSGSPYEDFCAKERLEGILEGRKIAPTTAKNLHEALDGMARYVLAPLDRELADVLAQYYTIGADGNGRYRAETIPSSACLRIVKGLAPVIVSNSVAYVKSLDSGLGKEEELDLSTPEKVLNALIIFISKKDVKRYTSIVDWDFERSKKIPQEVKNILHTSIIEFLTLKKVNMEEGDYWKANAKDLSDILLAKDWHGFDDFRGLIEREKIRQPQEIFSKSDRHIIEFFINCVYFDQQASKYETKRYVHKEFFEKWKLGKLGGKSIDRSEETAGLKNLVLIRFEQSDIEIKLRDNNGRFAVSDIDYYNCIDIFGYSFGFYHFIGEKKRFPSRSELDAATATRGKSWRYNFRMCEKDNGPITIGGVKTSFIYIPPVGEINAFTKNEPFMYMYESPHNHKDYISVLYYLGTEDDTNLGVNIPKEVFIGEYFKQRKKYSLNIPEDPFTFWKK